MTNENTNLKDLTIQELNSIDGGVVLTFCAIIGGVYILGEMAEAFGRACK